VRHLHALHPHVEEAQDESRVEARGPHDRRHPDPLGRHHHRLHVMQVEGRVLHVYKSRVEAREADQLDDLRVGDAADMRAERKPALAEDFLDAVVLHGAQPVVCLRMNCFIRSIAGAA
jgi:hypothetical protein